MLIRGLDLIVGHAPPKELAAAVAWAADLQAELAAAWKALNG